MQAFILVGSSGKQQHFLNSFYKENNIQEYNIHTYSEFKILDARSLTKILSKKLHIGDKRAVVIENPTIEAQHAILKTIEELPDNTFVFFLCLNSYILLQTINSRCKVHVLDVVKNIPSLDLDRDIELLFDRSKTFSFFEKHALEKDQIDEVIKSVRQLLMQDLKDYRKANIYYKALQKLVLLQPLVKNNNIQLRFALETILTP